MMKLQTYAAFSFLATITALYHAFSSRGQFYPAMVYLSTSKICHVLLINMGLVMMCITWQLVKRVFLGTLREAEIERLNEQSWREVMEILFAITIFRQDFSVTFLGMVTALLLIKAQHWLAQKRVEYIETTPSVPMLSHVRIVSFLAFLLAVDCLFIYNSFISLRETWSVALFFTFEYTILATTTISTFVKYVFYVTDMLMEGQWEKKAVYTFYLELVRDLLHLSLYIFFFLVVFTSYGIPLHLIRELYETFRNFRIRVADYIRYRKITSNMNERFPDATTEELNASDATCIICREEMVMAKKLLCGHLFHVHCLRSWLERQHTCPTCRALVVPPANGSAGSGRQGVPSDSRQHGSAAVGTSTQGSEGDVASDSSSRRKAKLHAASLAASIYEKSFAHPPINTVSWPPAYASTPQKNIQEKSVFGQESTVREAASPSLQQSHSSASMLQEPGPSIIGANPSSEACLLRAQEGLIQSQIKFLQAQLQYLQQLKTDWRMSSFADADSARADCKGKAPATASISDCGRHEDAED